MAISEAMFWNNISRYDENNGVGDCKASNDGFQNIVSSSDKK